MRTALLHIGTEKTGTQTLQRFLARNRAQLAARGILYPRSPGETNHKALTAFAQDDATRDELRIDLGVDDPADLARFRAGLTDALSRELAASGAARVILSNEHLSSRLTTAAELGRLRDLLASLFDRVEIAVYLRRQDEVAVSLYSTLLKFGIDWWEILPDPEDRPHYWDYQGLLARWSEAFGRDTVVPRIFSAADLVGGSVVSDFAASWGLGEGLAPVPNANESIRAPAQEVLRRLNTLYPGYHGDVPNRMRGELGQRMADLFPGPGVKPARGRAEAFAARFEAGNDAVRRDWFPERARLFSADFSAYPEAPDPRRFSFDEAVEVTAGLWGKGQARELELRAGRAMAEARLAAAEGRGSAARAAVEAALAADPGHGEARALRNALESPPAFNARWPAMQIFVVDSAKLLYLPIAKCACTTLKSLCVELSDLPEAEKARILAEVHGQTDGRRTGLQLKDHDAATARTYLSAPGWMRFAVVRDPIDRLVSAYVEKFVIRRERKGITTAPVVAALRGLSGPDAVTEAHLARGVRFREFLEFVLSEPEAALDPHWCPQSLSFRAIDLTEIYAIERLDLLAEDLARHLGRPVRIGALNRKRIAPTRRLAGAADLWPKELGDAAALHPDSFVDAAARARILEAFAADASLHRLALRENTARLARPPTRPWRKRLSLNGLRRAWAG